MKYNRPTPRCSIMAIGFLPLWFGRSRRRVEFIRGQRNSAHSYRKNVTRRLMMGADVRYIRTGLSLCYKPPRPKRLALSAISGSWKVIRCGWPGSSYSAGRNSAGPERQAAHAMTLLAASTLPSLICHMRASNGLRSRVERATLTVLAVRC